MFLVVSIQEREKIIKELKPLLRTKSRLVKIMTRKYDEVIEDKQKALDQKLMSDMLDKTSPSKSTNPTPLGMGESSKKAEETIEGSEVKFDKKPNFFVASVSMTLDTTLEESDPFQGKMDSAVTEK